ncbi:MAG: helix-turn-helix transcriptional regulator [Clostridia bacterium]|nr:helix-turn-helix transcriptional regulator [Clostridia bacterium]
MTLGERIKECRMNSGMSQEKIAEIVGVSRQAVTKWEANQSAPNTENLFKLAEIFGTTVDFLLSDNKEQEQTSAAQIYQYFKAEEEKKKDALRILKKRNIVFALIIVSVYLLVYLTGRIIWCDIETNSFIGWIVMSKPSGNHSYLYGWLLSSNMFIISMIISVLPAFWGKHKFSVITTSAFVFGLISGILFGPNPAGEFIGQSHYGWAIWGCIFVISIVIGAAVEILSKRRLKKSKSKD